MSTTIVNHRQVMHRPFRNIIQTYSGQTGSSSSLIKAGSHTSLDRTAGGMLSASTATTVMHRDEALLAIYVHPSEAGGVGHYKPFLLPPRNAADGSQTSLEKGLGYGAFGVVW